MANYFYLTLDTLGPAGPSVLIENGANFATQQLINLNINCSDSDTTAYQMKIWGSVDITNDTNIQDTEVASQWITYANNKQVKLSTGDGSKTIYLLIRDDVRNVSAQVSDTVLLDTSLPVVSISGPDVTKVSKIAARNIASFSFTVDSAFTDYKVKVVTTSNAVENTGVLIPTVGGSTNMSGTGSFPASTPINCTVAGADLEAASSGDGQKTIKVFVKDQAGQWNV